jgi:hypothetical protein
MLARSFLMGAGVRASVRRLSTEARRFPERGIADGVPPGVLQNDQMRKNMMNFKAAPEVLVLVGCVTFACVMGVTKLVWSDARSPETTWNPATRASFEKRVLERDTNQTEAWSKNFMHVGPFSRPREMLGIKPSDEKLDYKH